MSKGCDLNNKRCKPCEGDIPPLQQEEISTLLLQLDGWIQNTHTISKSFKFDGYYQTIAFVNAVAWLSHHEGHHPDLSVGYSNCRVEYSTHAINGLSENDFICAAKVDALCKI